MKRTVVTREQLAKVARDYYVNEVSQSRIARDSDPPVQQTTIASWLRQARELGIIAFDIDPVFGITGSESKHLRDRLKEAFDLEDCLVVEPHGITGDAADPAADDDLHNAVANRTGERLREWIQSTDHVGIAGGRAVTQVARYLKRSAHPRRDIRISPLSGRIWTGDWQLSETGLRRPLDADDAALLLAFAFEQQKGTRFSLIGHSLYPPVDEAHLHELFAEHCAFLPDGSWSREYGCPNRAIVGVGWLGGNHRIVEIIQRKHTGTSVHGGTHVDALANDFSAVMTVAKDTGIDLGDLANRLFPALPLPDDPALHDDTLEHTFKDLVDRLEDLNRKAVIVNWVHVRSIKSVWALCAGTRKIRVLWTVLLYGLLEGDRLRRLISEVSVDAATATALIMAKRDYDSLDQSVRTRYKDLARFLFPDGPPRGTRPSDPQRGRRARSARVD